MNLLIVIDDMTIILILCDDDSIIDDDNTLLMIYVMWWSIMIHWYDIPLYLLCTKSMTLMILIFCYYDIILQYY